MRTGAGTARIPSSSDPSAASGAAPSPPHPLFAAAPDGGGFDLSAIVTEFESSGFVVLLDVFGSEAREALSGDLRTLVELQSVGNVLGGAWPEDIPSSDRSAENLPPLFHPGHGGATMPRCAPWLTRDLIANPAWEAVVAQVIGAGAALVSTSGNTAFPGSGTQYLHVDSTWCHKSAAAAAEAGQPWPLPTTSIVVNFSTGDQSAANGATEVWPGSHNDPSWCHHDRSGSNPINNHGQLEMECREEVAARRAISAPIQPTVPFGAVLIRDMRLWHRGVNNPSDPPRPMFALIYTDAAGYRSHVDSFGHELAFSPTCRSAFEDSVLAPVSNIRFTDTQTAVPEQLSYLPRTVLIYKYSAEELAELRQEVVRVAGERPWTNYRRWMDGVINRAAEKQAATARL